MPHGHLYTFNLQNIKDLGVILDQTQLDNNIVTNIEIIFKEIEQNNFIYNNKLGKNIIGASASSFIDNH